jgi:PAS domain S-box-containing protein
MKALENYVSGRKFFESVVEDGSDIIFIVDFAGNIHYCNPSVKAVLGYHKNFLLGKNFFSYILPNTLADLKKRYHVSTQKKYSSSVEFQFLCKDKTYKYLEFNSINLKFQEGIPGLILDCRDITQRKKDAEELLRAQKAKELFLANISHEIRTPINGISGMATLLSKQPSPEDQATYLNAIKSAADNLKVIINDILDLASIESGKLKFESIGFSLKDVLDSLDDIFYIQAKEKGLNFTIELAANANTILLGDPVRLNQVLINLISNALKFTHIGSIKITVVGKKIKNKILIRFSIEDTGVGIPADKLTTIFESFSQADASVTRKYGGTGLGLTIVKQLVELQHGTIAVKSEENIGSTFVVSIPYSLTTSKKKMVESISSSREINSKSVKGLRILLVEDNDINRLYASSILKNWDCYFETAENGFVAIQKLKNQEFDIVLMDIQMPVMDGFEATKAIRNERFKNSKVPIIAITANVTKKDMDKCLAAGMNDYIVKPFTPDDLLILLKRYSKQIENKKKKITSFKTTISPRTTPDLSYLLKVGKGSKAFTDDIIETILKSFPAIIREIEILNFACNWQQLASAIHKVKPSLTMLGLHALKDEAAVLEDLFSKEKQANEPSSRAIAFYQDLIDAIENLKKLR